MTLRDDVAALANRGLDAVDARAAEWSRRALDRAAAHLGALPDEARPVAEAALTTLRADPHFVGDAAHLGVGALREALTLVSEGGLEALPGASSASFAERRAALHRAVGEALAERDRRERFRASLIAAGEAGLKAAAPLLLAAVGL